MNVHIGQIYIEPGVNFPFSYLMQIWLSEELSLIADPCDKFLKKYGADFELTVLVSADTQIVDNLIKGPTVFKKYKRVDYVVYLPYDVIAQAQDGCRAALEFLLAGIRSVFVKVGIDLEKLDAKRAFIIEHICSDTTMLKHPWPQSNVRHYH
jgi:hypothetical protein